MISWTKLFKESSRLAKERDRLPERSPSVIVWNITSRCNLSCRHCYFNATDLRDSEEITKDAAEDFIENLASVNVPCLIFSGGEPLLEKKIFGIASFAREMNIRTALSTNGTLITGRMAKKIKETGFSYVGVSLDGVEDTNDAFRQSEGAFEKALAGIRNCQDAHLNVGLRFTLTKYNFKDLPNIFELVEKESIPRICIYHLVYAGRGRALKDMDLNDNEKRGVMELVWRKALRFFRDGLNIEVLTVDNHADGVWFYLRLKRESLNRAKTVLQLLELQGGNSSGVKLAAVDNCGNIYPDQFWRTHSLGNILKKPFSDIWQDKENLFLQSLRNRRPLLKGRCRRCSFLSICNGNFRARAEASSGDPWQEDPGCYLTEEEIGERCYLGRA